MQCIATKLPRHAQCPAVRPSGQALFYAISQKLGQCPAWFQYSKSYFLKFVLVLLSTINCKGIQSNDFCWKVQRIKIFILHFEPFSLCKVFEIDLKGGHIKVHIFWEGHKILRNLHLTFDCMYCSQK